MAKLSVIVPVYKAGEYILKSSKSILVSSFKDLELILVDDGSPDGSGEACEQIAREDSRVKVIHKANGGISSARNAGIKAATGEYIAFVDQDDTVRADMYQLLMNKAAEGFDIVVSDFLLVYPDREEVYHTCDVFPDHDDTYRDMLLKGYGCNIWNMVVRRSVVENNGIAFPEHLRHGEDVWFSLRLHLCTDNIAKINEPLYIYNLANPQQVSAHLDNLFTQHCLRCIEETIPYIQSKGKFEKYKKELYWMVMQLKSQWVFSLAYYKDYRNIIPAANAYVKGNPLLSSNMQLVMQLINRRLDWIAYMLASLYKIKKH